MKITGMEFHDVRFPTSASGIGSDAVHTNPDYSAAYLVLKTDGGLEGHGLTFTVGDGNRLCLAAADLYRRLIVGRRVEDITADFGAYWRSLANDPQLRWLGPEKGVIHMALAAVVNAVWDLWAKQEKKPLWKLMSDLSPKELLRCVDFRYIEDALPQAEALELLERQAATKGERERRLMAEGYPAYNTSVGWMGYSDEKIRGLCRQGLAEGWTVFKVKVGGEAASDLRRVALVREEIGPDCILMLDANQRWDVPEAVARTNAFKPFKPLWMEEPTSPDDVLGHQAIRKAIHPVKVATGEHCQNRVVFKQLFQAGAIDYAQVDACRLGGFNENIAVLLMAAKFGVPVCPHAGGIGLCEYVQHISMLDYVAVSGSKEGRWTEFVDHLHEHFVNPVSVAKGSYAAPQAPGSGIELKSSTLAKFPPIGTFEPA